MYANQMFIDSDNYNKESLIYSTSQHVNGNQNNKWSKHRCFLTIVYHQANPKQCACFSRTRFFIPG